MAEDYLARITASQKQEITVSREELAEMAEALHDMQIAISRMLEKIAGMAKRLG